MFLALGSWLDVVELLVGKLRNGPGGRTDTLVKSRITILINLAVVECLSGESGPSCRAVARTEAELTDFAVVDCHIRDTKVFFSSFMLPYQSPGVVTVLRGVPTVRRKASVRKGCRGRGGKLTGVRYLLPNLVEVNRFSLSRDTSMCIVPNRCDFGSSTFLPWKLLGAWSGLAPSGFGIVVKTPPSPSSHSRDQALQKRKKKKKKRP